MFKFVHARKNIAQWVMVVLMGLALAAPLATPTTSYADGGCTTSPSSNCGG